MISFPLAHAVLCLDCEAVFCLPAKTCPLCASPVFVLLASWLSRGIEVAPSVRLNGTRTQVRRALGAPKLSGHVAPRGRRSLRVESARSAEGPGLHR